MDTIAKEEAAARAAAEVRLFQTLPHHLACLGSLGLCMYTCQGRHARDSIMQGWLKHVAERLRKMSGAVTRMLAETQTGCMQGPKEIGDIDTDDEKDEEEQYEQWKTRELRRIR